MDLNQIITLIKTVSDSNLTGFQLEEGNIKLCLEKNPLGGQQTETLITPAPVSRISVTESPAIQENTAACGIQVQEEGKGYQGEALTSPLVGTFYSSASPEDEPFVKVGDTVKKGQVLGIIEAMKLMNEIECEKDGIVEAILAENEQMVEYGQELFYIR